MTRGRRSMRFAPLVVGLFLVLNFARASEQGECGSEIGEATCQRVAKIVAHWNSPELQAIALAAGPESSLDSCRFNEAEQKIELAPSAATFSTSALTRCLATAYAHARYYTIEAQWLEKVGEHEAWINRQGTMVKVSVDRKLEPLAARSLWASFAARELVREAEAGSAEPERAQGVRDGYYDGPSRTIASTAAAPATSRDAEVRELLGLK